MSSPTDFFAMKSDCACESSTGIIHAGRRLDQHVEKPIDCRKFDCATGGCSNLYGSCARSGDSAAGCSSVNC
jgi:hypothetical protein